MGLPIATELLGLGRKGTGVGYFWREAANGESL